MIGKIIIALLVFILIGAGGYYYLYMMPTEARPQTPTVQQPEPLNTYASSTLGISISYPKNYSVNEAYTYDQFGEKKLIHGVKFVIPVEMATGTNLSANDTGVSIEWLPRAKTCTGDIYIKADVAAVHLTDGNVKYSVATTSEGAAGNFYEEAVYAISSSSPCTAVRYFIHSSNIGNFATGTVREFDRASLTNEFDKIRRSLKIGTTTERE